MLIRYCCANLAVVHCFGLPRQGEALVLVIKWWLRLHPSWLLVRLGYERVLRSFKALPFLRKILWLRESFCLIILLCVFAAKNNAAHRCHFLFISSSWALLSYSYQSLAHTRCMVWHFLACHFAPVLVTWVLYVWLWNNDNCASLLLRILLLPLLLVVCSCWAWLRRNFLKVAASRGEDCTSRLLLLYLDWVLVYHARAGFAKVVTNWLADWADLAAVECVGLRSSVSLLMRPTCVLIGYLSYVFPSNSRLDNFAVLLGDDSRPSKRYFICSDSSRLTIYFAVQVVA